MNQPPKGVYLPAVIEYLAGLPSGVVMYVYYDPSTWLYYIYAKHEPKIRIPRKYYLVVAGDFTGFFKKLSRLITIGCRVSKKS